MKLVISTSILILILFVLRTLVEGKISKKLQYAMWIILPLYLIGSVLFNIPFNIHNVDDSYKDYKFPYSKNVVVEDNHKTIAIKTDNLVNVPVVKEVISQEPEIIHQVDNVNQTSHSNVIKKVDINYSKIGTYVWIIGSGLVGLVIISKNLFFAAKVLKNRKYYSSTSIGNLKIYKLSGIRSPFLLLNNIYINEELEESSEEYKFATFHEYCHYVQGDSFWTIIRYLLVTIFWFNPLMWAASVVMERDGEMAVDERVISYMGKNNKTNYSETLLSYVSVKNSASNSLIAVTSINGNSGSFLKARVQNIMRGTRRSLAATLSVAIFMVSVVGCSIFSPKVVDEFGGINTDSEGKIVIDKDTPWYEVKEINLDLNRNYFSLQSGIVYVGDDNFVIESESRTISGTSRSDYEEKEETIIRQFNFDGELLGEIDVSSLMDYNVYDCVFSFNNQIYFSTFVEKSAPKIYPIDFTNGCLGEPIEIPDSFKKFAIALDGAISGYSDYNDKLLVASWDRSKIERIGLLDENFEFTELDIKDAIKFSMDEYFLLPEVLVHKVSDTKILFITSNSSERYYCLFDINSGEVQELSEDEVGVYTGKSDVEYYTATDGTYYSDGYSIKKFDLEKNEVSTLFTYGDTNADRSLLQNSRLRYADEDKVVFFDGSNVVVLSKSDNDIRKGKVLIKAAFVGDYFTPELTNAICEFNKLSDKYYISITDEYDKMYYHPSQYNDDLTEYFINANEGDITREAKLSDAIISGNGPDIIFNGDKMSLLNRDQCLIDLSTLINTENGIDTSKCFDNVFDNEKIYHIPFSIALLGVATDDYSVEGYGLTFDEYQTLLEKHHHLTGLENEYEEFMRSIDTVRGGLISDNKINLNNDQFKGILDYISTYTTFPLDSDFEWDGVSVRTEIHSIVPNKDPLKIYGYPQSEGYSAPVIKYVSSIGITTSCEHIDGAVEFINYALSDAIQTNVNCNASVPVNSHAYELWGEKIKESTAKHAEYYNTYVGPFDFIMDPDEQPYVEYPITDKELNSFRDSIEVASYIRPLDPEIKKIIWEESQVYFAGDRSFEDTARVIEDRAQKVLDERK